MKITPLAVAAIMLTTPSLAESYRVKVNPPKCEITTVKSVHHADSAADPTDPNFRCGACASAIFYTNGKVQDGSYSIVPGMEQSRHGDRVRLCLVSFLAGCPKGDNRGKQYVATPEQREKTRSWFFSVV
jgi:hypothetical protein